MEISTYFCKSCAVASIANLGLHQNAREAMLALCNHELATNKWGGRATILPKLNPNYVFCAGPEVSGKGHSKDWVKYGTEFAAFLLENGLGKVVTPGPIINARYHPDTTCQVWVWQPDQEAVEKWWNQVRADPLLFKGVV